MISVPRLSELGGILLTASQNTTSRYDAKPLLAILKSWKFLCGSHSTALIRVCVCVCVWYSFVHVVKSED